MHRNDEMSAFWPKNKITDATQRHLHIICSHGNDLNLSFEAEHNTGLMLHSIFACSIFIQQSKCPAVYLQSFLLFFPCTLESIDISCSLPAWCPVFKSF